MVTVTTGGLGDREGPLADMLPGGLQLNLALRTEGWWDSVLTEDGRWSDSKQLGIVGYVK